jgi:hypothetical protein
VLRESNKNIIVCLLRATGSVYLLGLMLTRHSIPMRSWRLDRSRDSLILVTRDILDELGYVEA